jgi:hypothetical protein
MREWGPRVIFHVGREISTSNEDPEAKLSAMGKRMTGFPSRRAYTEIISPSTSETVPRTGKEPVYRTVGGIAVPVIVRLGGEETMPHVIIIERWTLSPGSTNRFCHVIANAV